MMRLHHLAYFVATAEAGTVSAAAVRVHVTQPALSRQLRLLEQDLGVALFDRSAGRMTLSRTGRELLPRARAVLAAADALEESAGFHSAGGVERVTIAAPTVTLTDLVSPFVATMDPDDPVVDVRGGDGLTTAEMLQGGADLAIGAQRPPTPYISRPLAVLPVWAYVPPDDPWRDRQRVHLDEVLERQVIGLPTTFTARESLDAAVTAAGRSYDALLEAANGTIAQAMAAAGRGVAVVSDDPRFDLQPLEITTANGPLEIRLLVAWDSRSVAATTLERLADRLEAWIAHHYSLDG
jgi:DNA-binding transcriptional LysR family regulator